MRAIRRFAAPVLRSAAQMAARQGYIVQWLPQAMLDRESRLEISLEFVLPHLLLTTQRPFFLEIGANDGMSNDPLYPFVSRGLVSGILLEPLPAVFQQLAATHASSSHVRCLNAALAERDGEADFFTVNMDGISFDKAHQFSSFERASLLKQTSWVPDIADRIVRTQVRTVSFATLIEMAREMDHERIDVLHTDTEGFDGKVLDMMWEAGVEPAVVNFEKLHMSKEEINRQVARFAQRGYRLGIGDSDIVAYRAPESLGYR